MKQTYLFIGIMLVLVSTTRGFAIPFLGQMTPLRSNENSRDDQGCPNFGGLWKGQCSVGDSKLAIKQHGCSELTVNGQQINIGELKNQSESFVIDSSGPVAASLSAASDWANDRSRLKIKMAGIVRELGKGEPIVFQGDVNTYLEDGNLVADYNVLGKLTRCVYTKEH